jgi:hypothetical protein
MLWLIKVEILENRSSIEPRSVLYSVEAPDLHDAQIRAISLIYQQYPEHVGFQIWQIQQWENPCKELLDKMTHI